MKNVLKMVAQDSRLIKLVAFLVLIISMQLTNMHGLLFFSKKEFAKAANEQILELNPTSDIFISPSTQTGNRRMLLAGTYTDYTICLPEDGCPPTFSDSYSLLNFDWNQVPTNAIILSAKLQIFHYGSNSSQPFNLKISKVDSIWAENSSSLNAPNISGSFGSAMIPSFNTNDSSQIALREININSEFFDNSSIYQNGIALSSTPDISSPGIVFCSKDSDSFCLPQYKPKLILTFVPNNPPLKPNISAPETNSFIGGNCDYSILPLLESCTLTKTVNFAANNLIDNDPASGAFSYSKFVISSVGFPDNISQNINSNPEANWQIDLENGTFSVISESYDKKGVKTSSDPVSFIIDTLPPEIPTLQDLADITKPAQNKININISASPVTDNTNSQTEILYQLQYSTDSSFSTNVKFTDWQAATSFALTEKEISPSQTFFFRMRSKDKYNNSSDWSNTAVTSIEGLPKTPVLNKTGWVQNRFKTNSFITNIRNNSFEIKAQKGHKVEAYINNKKVGESIADQSCANTNGEELCNAIINYNYSGLGRNDANGVPLDFFSIQFRAIDANQNTSILTNKESIYFDNTPPSNPTLALASDKNMLDINSITTVNGNKLISTITAEKFSDLEYRLIDPKGKTLDYGIVRIPATKNATITSNLKLDGKYKLELTSIDAAGNRSGKVVKDVERDTVGAQIINAKASECGKGICIEIEGEQGSKIIINNKEYGILDTPKKTVKVINYYRVNYNYNFQVQLQDPIGNKGINKTTDFYYEIGGIGANNEDLAAARSQSNVKELELNRTVEIKIDKHGNASISNFGDLGGNAPILIDAFKDITKDNETTVYGNAIRIGSISDQATKVTRVKKLGLGDALSTCGASVRFIDPFKVSCVIENSDVNDKFIVIYSNIAHIQCVSNGFSEECLKSKLNELSPEKSETEELKLTYKVNKNTVYTYVEDRCIDNCQNEISDRSFFEKIYSDNEAKEGARSNARSNFHIGFEYASVKHNVGVLSNYSNEISIPSPTYAFNEPVGFPFWGTTLVRKSENESMWSSIGAKHINKLCESGGKFNCNGSSKVRGYIMVARASSETHLNAIDFNISDPISPSQRFIQKYNTINNPVTKKDQKVMYREVLVPLSPVFSTVDGEIVLKNKNSYGYEDYNLGCHKFDDLEAEVKSSSGHRILFKHLDPASLDLDIWNNSGGAQRIKRGQLIGYMGITGCSTGVHLHYQVNELDKDGNPKDFKLINNYIYESLYNEFGLENTIQELQTQSDRQRMNKYMENYLKYNTKGEVFKNEKLH